MTKFHFAGHYNDDPNSLKGHEHEPGHVQFKEARTMKELSLKANGLAVIIALFTFAVY